MKYVIFKNNSYGKRGKILELFDNKEELLHELNKRYNLAYAKSDYMLDQFKEQIEGNDDFNLSFKDFVNRYFELDLKDEELEQFINNKTQILYSVDEGSGTIKGTMISNEDLNKNNINISDINYCLEVLGEETTLFGIKNTFDIKEIPEVINVILDTVSEDTFEIEFKIEEGLFEPIKVIIDVEETRESIEDVGIGLKDFIMSKIKDTIDIEQLKYFWDREEIFKFSINNVILEYIDDIVEDVQKTYNFKIKGEETEEDEI